MSRRMKKLLRKVKRRRRKLLWKVRRWRMKRQVGHFTVNVMLVGEEFSLRINFGDIRRSSVMKLRRPYL